MRQLLHGLGFSKENISILIPSFERSIEVLSDSEHTDSINRRTEKMKAALDKGYSHDVVVEWEVNRNIEDLLRGNKELEESSISIRIDHLTKVQKMLQNAYLYFHSPHAPQDFIDKVKKELEEGLEPALHLLGDVLTITPDLSQEEREAFLNKLYHRSDIDLNKNLKCFWCKGVFTKDEIDIHRKASSHELYTICPRCGDDHFWTIRNTEEETATL